MKHNTSVEKLLKTVRPTPVVKQKLTTEQQIQKIEKNFREIMETLGLDLSNDSLKETPRRVAKMYVKELFAGLKEENFPKISVIENEMDYDQMIVAKRVNIKSM